MSNEKVAVTLELTSSQAWALAQFVKRTSHSDCEAKATEDAYLMMDGVNEVMRALANTGFDPR